MTKYNIINFAEEKLATCESHDEALEMAGRLGLSVWYIREIAEDKKDTGKGIKQLGEEIQELAKKMDKLVEENVNETLKSIDVMGGAKARSIDKIRP